MLKDTELRIKASGFSGQRLKAYDLGLRGIRFLGPLKGRLRKGMPYIVEI